LFFLYFHSTNLILLYMQLVNCEWFSLLFHWPRPRRPRCGTFGSISFMLNN
jgi:hypothetical protein